MTHIITVTAGDEKPEVKFECTYPQTEWCRTYPDSESWIDDDGQERIPHDECWIQGWMDNDAYDYTGADAVEDSWGDGGESVPNITRSGPVKVTFVDEYVEWQWAESGAIVNARSLRNNQNSLLVTNQEEE